MATRHLYSSPPLRDQQDNTFVFKSDLKSWMVANRKQAREKHLKLRKSKRKEAA